MSSNEDDPLHVNDIDWGAQPFVIPIGDFAGWELPFNDPLLPFQAFITGFYQDQTSSNLISTRHINLLPVWEEYSGAGISIANLEQFEEGHPDLLANSNGVSPEPNAHGTATAGLVASEANNGLGIAGIAYGASHTYVEIPDVKGFDILQSSVGGQTLPPIQSSDYGFQAGAEDAAATGRDGLGTVWVNAIGNGGGNDTSAELSVIISTFQIMTVAEGEIDSFFGSFSTFGSSLHITGLLGSFSSINVITADLQGEAGVVTAEHAAITFFDLPERGVSLVDAGVSAGDYRSFNGSSAAAPVVSGSVALMLEASGNNIFGAELGWRDVQEILAISSRHMGSHIGADYSELAAGEHHPWANNGANNVNGGGFHFSPDYGFGYIDVHAAVRLSETWGLTRHSHNLVTQENGLIGENGQTFSYGNPITLQFEASGDALDLDVVELAGVLTHEAYREVQITITSPDGTVSYIFDTPGLDADPDRLANWMDYWGEDAFGGTLEDRTFLSRAFWGEETTGTWTITIEDMVDNGNEGSISGVDLIFKGDLASDDDTYYFTSDWSLMNEANGGVPVLSDTNGANAINAAAIMDDVAISLVAGKSSQFGGETAFSLSSDAVINTAIAGDGNDRLTGNAADNLMYGMRGADKIFGAAGADNLSGGAGADTLRGDAGADFVYGGAGDDQVWAGGSDDAGDTVIGGDGADTLAGKIGNDFIVGDNFSDGTTQDFAVAAEGDATLDGADQIFGGAGSDTILGGGWTDTVVDNGQYDAGEEITSGTAENSLWSGIDDDLIHGAGGNDIAGGSGGDDTLYGHGGNDTLYGGAATGDQTSEDVLYGGAGADLIYGGSGGDTIDGGSGDDRLSGGSGADSIDGGDGADNVFSGGGNDIVDGGMGDDTLWAGRGDDQLTGGAGADLFVFVGNSGKDTVSDFSVADDTLVMDATVTDFTSIDDVVVAATAHNGGVLIDLGGGNSVFLEGISLGDIDNITWVL